MQLQDADRLIEPLAVTRLPPNYEKSQPQGLSSILRIGCGQRLGVGAFYCQCCILGNPDCDLCEWSAPGDFQSYAVSIEMPDGLVTEAKRCWLCTEAVWCMRPELMRSTDMEVAKMRCFIAVALVLGLLPLSNSTVKARDSKLLLPLRKGLEAKDSHERLDGTVKFFFGAQQHPKVIARFGTYVANRKTNAVNKSDERACNWVFLSAVVSLERRAKQLGANAVVNIVSFYRGVPMSSTTEFECHAGNIVAGVALRGEFVTIVGR